MPRRARDLVDRGRDQTTDVHDHDRGGVGSEARLEVGGVDRHGLRVAVDEAQARPGVDGGRRGGEERVGRHDDLAALHPDRAQDDLERGRSGADGDGVASPVADGEGLLELTPDRAERQLTARERFVDHRQDRGAVFRGEKDPSRRHTHGDRI